MRKNIIGEFLLIIATILWGSSYVVIQWLFEDGLSVLQILFLRMFISSILFFIYKMRSIKYISLITLKKGLYLGIALFLAFFLVFTGQQGTTPSKAAFLTSTFVIFVPFISYFFYKEKITITNLISAFISIIAINLMTIGDMGEVTYYDLILILGAILFAFHMVLIAHFIKEEKASDLNLIQITTMAALSFIAMKVNGESIDILTKSSMLYILYLSVFCTFIAFLIQTIAQRYTTASKASILLSTETFFATLFSIFLYGENLGIYMIIGYILMFISILLSQGILIKNKS